MEYKVKKLKQILDLPDFNVKEESEDICKLCKMSVPRKLEFIGPVCVGDTYIDLCPRCARGIRNLILRQDPTTMFPSDETNRRYHRFISWLVQQGLE